MSVDHQYCQICQVKKKYQCFIASLKNMDDLENTYSELVNNDKASIEEIRSAWLALSTEMREARMLTGTIGDELTKMLLDIILKF